MKTFFNSVLAGIAISIGGIAYLSLDNKVLGALFFTVGLFTVLTFGLDLFTGKVCYALDNKNIAGLFLIWVGNLVGTIITATLINLTRLDLVAKAESLVNIKLSDSLISIFILSVLCNILIFIAVDGFKNNPHELGKYLSIFFGVTVFILCGFEHCVANMFYISLAGSWKSATLFILINTFGNALGGLLIPTVRKIQKSE